MTPAPNPPPRGGAEPRVSDAAVAHDVEGANGWARLYALDLRDARAECADLRAKLEAAEARILRERESCHEFMAVADAYCIRADAAEAALREMTEQRDGAREAALDAAATRLMLWADEQALPVPPEGWSPSALLRQAATSLSALAPSAETAAKEERT